MSSKEIPNGFKMTELGTLPEGWGVVKANEIFIRITDGTHETPKKLDKGIPLIKSKQIKDGKVNFGDIDYYISLEDHETINKRSKVDRFDILLSMIGTVGEVALVKEDPNFSIKNVGLFKLNSNHDLAIYSHYYFQSNLAKKYITENLSGTSQKYITLEKLRQFPIILPSLPEQRAIATVLSTVQDAKEKTDAVITATKELKKSLMKHLFTYGPVSLEEAENVPLKETEIGMVPEAWDVVMLGDVVKKTEQKDPRKTPECQFKYIDVSSINREDLKIVEYKLYKGKDAPSRAKKLVKNNDVIFATVRPTLRRFTLIEEDFNGEICSTAFCVLRAKESFLSSLYVLYVVQRDIFIDELGKIQRGASYPAVTDSNVKNQKIPLPPPSIQQKIASILSAVDEKIEKEETKKKSLEELFKTLLHNLMTGKLRVNHREV